MKFINLVFMLISINFISYEVSATGLGDLEEVYTLFMNIWTRVDEGIEEANTGKKPKYQATLFGDKTSSMLEALLDKVDELSVQMETMENRLMDKMQEISDAVKSVPDKVRKDQLLTKISHYIKSIKIGYKEVKKLGSKKITKVKAKKIIDKYVREKITDDLREIFIIVLPDDEADEENDRSLLKLMVTLENDEKESKERCDKKNSPQQFLYQLYLTLVSTEMIGYTSLAYGFAVNELIRPDEKADVEIQTVIDDILDRIYHYNLGFSKSIAQLSRHFRTCDNPGKHERGVTFIEFTGLYQRIVLAEYSNERHKSCAGSCNIPSRINEHTYCFARPEYNTWDGTYYGSVYTRWDSNGRPESIGSCTTNLNCAGTINNCFEMTSIRYCMDRNYTHRRYTYVGDSSNNNRFGPSVDCTGNSIYDYWDEKSVGKASRYGGGDFAYCNYCMCTCNDDTWEAPFAVNAISLLPSRSDTWNNMVITGMRMKVHQKIVHIQIKQGKIIDNFHIETPKIKKNKKKKNKKANIVEKWVDLPDMEKDVRASRRYKGPQNLREDVDFVAWHWDHNAFNLDEVSIPPGRVLTGVRFSTFKMREGDKKWRVQVEAESMEYDHIVGKLIQCTEEWTKPDPKNHDVKLEFVNDLPINSDQPTILDSETNQYVIPSMSDDWKDAGQSVLPFMDAQTIGCSPEAPLGGIGLHHRGVAKDSEDSGFLGLTAHTVNYASYLKQSAEKYAEARKRQKEEEDDEDDDDDDDDGDGDDDDDDDDEDEDDDDDDEDDDDDD